MVGYRRNQYLNGSKQFKSTTTERDYKWILDVCLGSSSFRNDQRVVYTMCVEYSDWYIMWQVYFLLQRGTVGVCNLWFCEMKKTLLKTLLNVMVKKLIWIFSAAWSRWKKVTRTLIFCERFVESWSYLLKKNNLSQILLFE